MLNFSVFNSSREGRLGFRRDLPGLLASRFALGALGVHMYSSRSPIVSLTFMPLHVSILIKHEMKKFGVCWLAAEYVTCDDEAFLVVGFKDTNPKGAFEIDSEYGVHLRPPGISMPGGEWTPSTTVVTSLAAIIATGAPDYLPAMCFYPNHYERNDVR
jgi:hypothetical protein